MSHLRKWKMRKKQLHSINIKRKSDSEITVALSFYHGKVVTRVVRMPLIGILKA